MTQFTGGRGLVVGVDGTEESVAALRWAAQQARALHTEVVAVHAWEPVGPLHAPYAPPSARPTAAEQRARAARLLTMTLRAAFGPQMDGTVRAVLAEGRPARVLLQHAHDAVLLALGLKTHSEYGAAPLGAVGRECLRHATVPVVAVPGPERAAPAKTPAHHAAVVRPLVRGGAVQPPAPRAPQPAGARKPAHR